MSQAGRPASAARRLTTFAPVRPISVRLVPVLACVLAAGCAAAAAGPDGSAATRRPAPAASSPAGSAPASRSPGARHSPVRHHARKSLAGKVVGIDPGHNGRNGSDPSFLTHQVFNGRTMEDCDTAGTQTAGGYTESRYTFNVATYLTRDLRKDGARVVLTRHSDHGLGPCVNRRSQIINKAHADVAIDIHADGGPSWGRGFTVLEPVADGPNNHVIASSDRFGRFVHQAFVADTPMRISNYYGHDGYISRTDLAGLNLTTVPKVLIETGNMPNAADAALLTSPRVQRQIARALEYAIIRFLTGRWPPGSAPRQ